jgi:hypothetical protein
VLPPGATLVQAEADGTLRIETATDPMRWLQQVPAGCIESAEVGIPRLEDLYELLLQQQRSPA